MEKQTITIYDVAREAGVSMATVSRVVNGNPNVKPATRKKVSEVIERLNYRPNAVARGLASKKTTTVGVIIPNITDLYFASLARGIDDIAAMYKYNIILANSDVDQDREIQVFNTLLAKQVDGIIYMGYEVKQDTLQEIKSSSTPVVFAGTEVPDDDSYVVNIDVREATKDVTDRLLERHEKIAIITGPSDYRSNQNRVKGYQAAYEEKGLSLVDDLVIQTGLSFKEADRIVDDIQEIGATAVILANDEMAISISNILQDRNVSIPEDIEIVTSLNTMLTQLSRPTLSSIEIPLYDIGAVAMRLLTKIMNKEEVHEKHVPLPHKLVKRGSTRG